jgi:hypothetical protein
MTDWSLSTEGHGGTVSGRDAPTRDSNEDS